MIIYNDCRTKKKKTLKNPVASCSEIFQSVLG